MQGNITARWSGWSDSPAGIHEYEIEVYKMDKFGETLGYKTGPIFVKNVNSTEPTEATFSLHPTEPGQYSVSVLV